MVWWRWRRYGVVLTTALCVLNNSDALICTAHSLLSIMLHLCTRNTVWLEKIQPHAHCVVDICAGKAMKLLELAVELDDSNVQAHIQLLTILARVDTFRHRAPSEMQQALQKFPNNVHIMHLCASFLLECGQDDAAAALLARLAKLQPQNGQVACTQGLLHMKQGQRETAACCFKRGMTDTLAQNALLCYEELAKLAVLEGRPEVARHIFQHGAGTLQPSSRFLREWGLFERKLGNVSQVELRAMDVRSWVAWALLERSQEGYTQALEVLRQVHSQFSNFFQSICAVVLFCLVKKFPAECATCSDLMLPCLYTGLLPSLHSRPLIAHSMRCRQYLLHQR
jgi:Tfp pilus assembly protein PilF